MKISQINPYIVKLKSTSNKTCGDFRCLNSISKEDTLCLSSMVKSPSFGFFSVFRRKNNEGEMLKSAIENCGLSIYSSDIYSLRKQKGFNAQKFIEDLNKISPAIQNCGVEFEGDDIVYLFKDEDFDAEKFAKNLDIITPYIEDSPIRFKPFDVKVLCTSKKVPIEKYANDLAILNPIIEDYGISFNGPSFYWIYDEGLEASDKYVSDLQKLLPALKETNLKIGAHTIRALYNNKNFNAEKYVEDLKAVAPIIKENGYQLEGYEFAKIYSAENFDGEKFKKDIPIIARVEKESGINFSDNDIRSFYENENFDMTKMGDDLKSILPIWQKVKNSRADVQHEMLTDFLIYKNLPDSLVPLQKKLRVVELMKKIENFCTGNSCSGNVRLSEKETKFVKSVVEEISSNMDCAISPTQVSADNISMMFKGFFTNNNPQIDKIIKNTDFTQFGKDGVPLKYPRKDFVADLNRILCKVDAKMEKEILDKLGISLTSDCKGYDGIIDLSKLSSNGIEGKVLNLANKFIKENSIQTGNSKLNEVLNSLIKGMPEIVNVIGKQQHPTHKLSVDTHIFTVYKECLLNPNYEKLSDIDKTCLKVATILHDIGKEEGVIDRKHPKTSSVYVRDILQKYDFSSEVKNRIQELVANHHWLEAYNKGIKDADYIAGLFRRPNDFEVAKIMAEADLKGVSDAFYERYGNALNNLEPIEQAYKKHNEKGQMILTSRVLQESKLPKVNYNRHTYKVVDFTKLDKDFDLSEYGFEKGLTPKDFRLFAHMTCKLDVVKTLSNPTYEGLLCTSYITPYNKATYMGAIHGLSLQAENINIANASHSNQGSGSKKGFDFFVEYLKNGKCRDFVPQVIQQELNITEEEYAVLYDKLADKNYYAQIKDDCVIKLGKKEISGVDIKKAIKKANNMLLLRPNNDRVIKNNEINLYTPEINGVIAKVNKISEILPEFLDFARENDLPIFILGKDNCKS